MPISAGCWLNRTEGCCRRSRLTWYISTGRAIPGSRRSSIEQLMLYWQHNNGEAPDDHPATKVRFSTQSRPIFPALLDPPTNNNLSRTETRADWPLGYGAR